jgi:FdhD protein
MPATRIGPDDATLAVTRARFDGEAREAATDVVVREEPLEIRIAGVSIAVVMRTPGNDRELVRGFAITERIVEQPSDLVAVRHCDRVEVPDAEDNVVQIVVAPHVDVDLARLRRNLFASSSCGVCGKASIATAMATAGPVATDATITIDVLRSLPDRLRTAQPVFDRTGGLHGAGLFATDGTPWAVREDVGRHNALDKLVGWAAEHRTWPLPACALAVSGRVSFEIVQKAVAARIPFIVAVSAPSSLAIELAEQAGITLAAFVRGDRASVYTHASRVA